MTSAAGGARRIRLVARGRVQGVGFRYFVLRRAEEMGLAGWVTNRADGAVEAEAEGAEDALEAFAKAFAKGPPGARVTGCDRAEIPPIGSTDFRVV